MASVNWKKYKSTGYVKAVLRHNCRDSRENTGEHTNPHIQPELTPSNTGVWDCYAEAVERYDNRMAAIESPKRKDAVVGLGFSIPAPKGLSADKEEAWFARVFEIMGDKYGRDNIACFAIHRDEVHDYMDPDTGEMETSRVHAQGIIVPELDGKLCAKKLTSRGQMVAINNAIHEMSVKEYGLKWMDGTKSKSKGNVELLKNKSEKAELDSRASKLKAAITKYNEAVVKYRQRKAEQDKRQMEQEAEAEHLRKRAKRLDDREQKLDEREAALKAREAACDVREADTRRLSQEAVERLQKAEEQEKRNEERSKALNRREQLLGRQESAKQLHVPGGNSRKLPEIDFKY